MKYIYIHIYSITYMKKVGLTVTYPEIFWEYPFQQGISG